MRNIMVGGVIVLSLVALQAAVHADESGAQARRGVPSVQPSDLGIVEAPTAGSAPVDLSKVPAAVLHAANVALKSFDGTAQIVSAQFDQDDIEAVHEIRGRARDGRLIEVDVLPNGHVEELEVEINRNEVPAEVSRALSQYLPEFELGSERPSVEKSIRPTKAGLSEVWYEFSGAEYDVEVRSDGRALTIEPA